MPTININGFKITVNEDTAKAIAAFVIGKNSKEIGAWLVKLGQALGAGKTTVVGTMAAKAGIKVAGLAGAIAFAYGTVNQAIKNGEKVLANNDKSVLEKVGSFLWETSIPKATWDQLVSFGRWITKKPAKDKEEAVKEIQAIASNKLSDKERREEFNRNHPNPGQSNKPVQSNGDDLEQLSRQSGYSVEALKHMPTADLEILRERVGNNNNMGNQGNNNNNPRGNNDPRWHMDGGNENPIQLAGTPGFATAKGSFYDSPLKSSAALPSTMGIELVLTWGKTYYDLQDVRKKSIIAAVDAIKAKNRYTTVYGYGDICKYIVNLRLLYAMFALGKTNYQLLLKYQKTDDTLPSGLFAARRFDYVTWKASMSQIRSDLADLRKAISVLAHFDLNLFKRTMQCFNYIYKDSNSRKAQYYTFTLSRRQAYYDFNAASPSWTTLDLGTRSLSSNSTGMTYTQWITAITTLINATKGAVVDEMKKSLVQALGNNIPKELSVPAEFEELEFTYSEEILQQIENADCITTIGADASTWTITDDADGFPVDPASNFQANISEKSFMNYHKDTVKKEDLVVASRLKYRYGTIDGTTYGSWGSEVVNGYKIYTRSPNSSYYNKLYSSQYGKYAPISGTDAATFIATVNEKLGQILAFDWAPHVAARFGYSGSSFSGQDSDTINVDWDNFTVITGANADLTSPNLNDYNRGSIFGLFVGLEKLAKKKASIFNDNKDDFSKDK